MRGQAAPGQTTTSRQLGRERLPARARRCARPEPGSSWRPGGACGRRIADGCRGARTGDPAPGSRSRPGAQFPDLQEEAEGRSGAGSPAPRPRARETQPDVGSYSPFWEAPRDPRAALARPGGGWGRDRGGDRRSGGSCAVAQRLGAGGRHWLQSCAGELRLRAKVEGAGSRGAQAAVGVPRVWGRAGRGKRFFPAEETARPTEEEGLG